MKRHFSLNSVVFFSIALVALLLSGTATSFAQSVAYGTNGWDDRSDELPGMMSTNTLVLIGAGTALAVGAIVYASKKKREDRKKDEEEDGTPSQANKTSLDVNNSLELEHLSGGWQNRLLQAKDAAPFNVSVGMERPVIGSPEKGVVVRLSLKF